MRPDRLYLEDFLAAADAIDRFLSVCEERSFLGDEVLQSAVLHKLTVIGEAANRLSAKLRQGNPEIEWRTIVGLRNVVVHEYFAVSWPTIWLTAREDIPALAVRVREILDSLDG